MGGLIMSKVLMEMTRFRVGDAGHTIFGPPNGKPLPDTIATIHKAGYEYRHLLAAAPELLDACYKAIELINKARNEGVLEARTVLAAAVSKAHGIRNGKIER